MNAEPPGTRCGVAKLPLTGALLARPRITMPEFPDRFDSIEQAREFCRVFFPGYNLEHRHSGIGPMTPAAVHYGQAQQLHAARARVLEAAYARNPGRFVRKPPAPPELPTAARINKPDTKEVAH